MAKICKQCQFPFEITEADRAFYQKLEVPHPTLCPQCREQRRLAFRNERHLSKRKCDACGKNILSVYSPRSPFKQYCNQCYFSDTWDARDYALDFDFQKNFFDQFQKLYDAVPKLSLYVKQCENCDYTNIGMHNKNCYLLFGSGFNQDCFYSTALVSCENCMDCSLCEKCRECYQLIDCENVSGNFIYHSKNAFKCYNIWDCKDVNHLVVCLKQKDSGDAMGTSLGELAYECLNNDYAHQTRWCMNSTYLNNCDYCDSCDNAHHLFGCVGLRHAAYCIFNKQYTPETYTAMGAQIIEHMKKNGEFGGYFPISISPFSYYETVAHEYYPLTKEQVLILHGKWEDEDAQNIEEVPKNNLQKILTCKNCEKHYKIIQQELHFYQKYRLALQEGCPECRHTKRVKIRNPRRLWKRHCSQCSIEIHTSFPPNTSKKVFCEKCYLQAVY